MFFIISLILLSITPAVAQEAVDWSQVDRIGLYQTPEDGQIKSDLWRDYSQEDAIKLIDKLPDRLSSPEYRTLAKKLLLSEAKPSKDNTDAPTLLSARLNKLISYGLFDEANQLYQMAREITDNADNYELSLVTTQMSLINGSLAPTCLDIQASMNQFRDMNVWRELSSFCLYRFGSANKIKLDALSFTSLPVLKSLLKTETIDIREPKTNIGTLIAFMDNRINTESYNDAAREPAMLDDLKIRLALDKQFSNQETYQCYAIEAAKRGIINAKDLEMTYQSTSFSRESLHSTSGAVTLHPCSIPAFFYQRLKNTSSPEETAKNVAAMLEVTENIPAIALIPMAKEIESYALPQYQWRSAIILGLSDLTIPDSFTESVWPIKSIQQSNQMRSGDYIKWFNSAENKIIRNQNLDPALPLYISIALSSDLNNLRGNIEKIEYENIFSLTYAQNSIDLGLGFYDFIRHAQNKKDSALVVSSILSSAGLHEIKNMNPHDISVILSSLKAYKLDKEAVSVALEYLQY